jgi:prephenate dehydrogenase
MTVKITIIGLGQIGASMGMALANHKDQVTILGHDKSAEIARKAQKLGAVECVSFNLPASVEGADVIVLAIPYDAIYETLKFIAQDVREEAVVLDTGPVKSVAAGWVKELLPPKRYYIGLTPALNPACLEDASHGLDAARADLFQHGVVAVSAPQGTAEEAHKLAADFVTLLGSQPYFADMAEVDGMWASAGILPGLSAAAMVETVTNQPGWPDIRKLAGKSFSTALLPLEGEESGALAGAVMSNRENTLRIVDEYILTLSSLRRDIEEENLKGLTARLEESQRRRIQWKLERAKGDWLAVESRQPDLPKVPGIWKQQIGGLDKLFRRGEKKKPGDE